MQFFDGRLSSHSLSSFPVLCFNRMSLTQRDIQKTRLKFERIVEKVVRKLERNMEKTQAQRLRKLQEHAKQVYSVQEKDAEGVSRWPEPSELNGRGGSR
jgi:(p)ppGpp synthase/HD superfamily hydrolase